MTGLSVNLLLSFIKFGAGLLGRSGAMIADAAHSLSDCATDIVVLFSFSMAGKPADEDHPYGHGKYETLATAIIGSVLLLAGAGIFWSGVTKVYRILSGESIGAPGKIALVAAAISVLVKEMLYHYTSRVGRRIRSQALIANAWHHRSDAGSSVGTLLGIGGAIYLGERWHILDPIAAIVVSLFVVWVAFEIFTGSIKELVEASLDEDTCSEIMQLASSFDDISDPHNLRTRKIGNDIAVDMHIRLPPEMPVVEAHAIATRLEEAIRDRFGKSTFISIHIEPERYKQGDSGRVS